MAPPADRPCETADGLWEQPDMHRIHHITATPVTAHLVSVASMLWVTLGAPLGLLQRSSIPPTSPVKKLACESPKGS
jgi:hypothetical protein